MKMISSHIISSSEEGPTVVRAVILADTTPDPLPTSGADVEGMAPGQVFAPFSVLYVAGDADTKLYVTNESGVFVPQ